MGLLLKPLALISIHAPSRERRCKHRHAYVPRQISIHAPSRERQTELKNILRITAISIHAPSRERRYRVNIHHAAMNFNPRSLAGATTAFVMQLRQRRKFQSTLPRGSDFAHVARKPTKAQFQSTLPRGSDSPYSPQHKKRILISIHAPSRERHRA